MQNSLIGQMVKVPWLGNWSFAVVTAIAPSRCLVCVDKHGGVSHEVSDQVLVKSQCEPRRINFTDTVEGQTAWMLAKEKFNAAWNAQRALIAA